MMEMIERLRKRVAKGGPVYLAMATLLYLLMLVIARSSPILGPITALLILAARAVAALTSGENARYDVQVEVKAPEGGLHHNSIVLLNQIRTIDKRRVGRYWGRLSAQTMQQVDEAIKISLGLVPI